MTQETAECDEAKVRFPKHIKHRGQVLATIYGRCEGRDSYRVAWRVAGQRRMASFASYSLAKGHADKLVKDLAKGSQVTALHPAQARDALAAFERLEDFYRATGRRVSLLAGISVFVEASTKLDGRTVDEAVEGFLRTAVTVKRKDIMEAVEDFITSRQHKTEAKDGKRAQLSDTYTVHINSWLRKFAGTFPGTAVCDLSKELLSAYAKTFKDFTPKTRNHRRATVKMFLKWCVRQDYLPLNHRLFEADCLACEIADSAETDFFRPAELRTLLDNASVDLRPVIAIAGLAGLRGEEIMRLDWGDVWRVKGHIEVTARNAKTRQRRLVEVCPALQAWLEPHRKDKAGKVYAGGVHAYQKAILKLRKSLKIPDRLNGLRHAFCTYHFALHSNENLTAAQAGNSPAMIHAHYKGLATKADAEKWFNVAPLGTGADTKPQTTTAKK